MRTITKLADGKVTLTKHLDYTIDDAVFHTIDTPGLLIEVKHTPGTIGEQLFKEIIYIVQRYSEDAEKPIPQLLPVNIRKAEDYFGKVDKGEATIL